MSSTLTIRFPEELLEQLRKKARRCGLPVGKVVREAVATSLALDQEPAWKQFVGVVKGGPRNLSSRKGFSRE